MDKYQENDAKISETSGILMSEGRSFLDKTLSAALDSFDNLFCRRCLVIPTILNALYFILNVPVLIRVPYIHRYLIAAFMVVLKA